MSERASAGEMVSTAAEAGGNVAGAVLGALFVGPDGAVAGAAISPPVAWALKRAVVQIRGWVGGRQVERVSETIKVAATDIEKHLSDGGQITGFFANVGDEGSDAEEIAEGILQAAAFAYEQRKTPYLGHLLASIAIRGDIHLADAHRLTRLVGELSYRQLACLSAIGSGEAKIDTIQAGVVRSLAKRDRMSAGIAEEVEELSNTHDLIGSRDSTQAGDIATSSGITLGHRTLPRNLALTERGYFLFELLRLDTLPGDDRLAVVGELLGMGTADLAT
jgi:hypothetical protein